MQALLFVLGFLLFIGLILIHEWGHMRAARRAGVKVIEFGLGFPPRAWARKLKSGMIISLNWLPLGGFVRLKGEHATDNRPGSFGAAPLKAKTKIILAGVAMNLIAGMILLTILAATGLPVLINKASTGQDQFTISRDTKQIKNYVYIQNILPGSPAAQAGLSSRDIIETISTPQRSQAITSAATLRATTSEFAGQTVTITYKHNGQQKLATAPLLSNQAVNSSLNSTNPKGYLGVITADLQVRRSSWSSPIVAVGLTSQLAELTGKGLWHALSGLGSIFAGGITGNTQARQQGQTEASSQVGGPVAVATILWDNGALGVNFVLVIIAIISLTLALVNILPIPALDGGRLLLILIFRLMKKPLKPALEDRIHGTGMLVLLALFVLITIVDVKRF